VSFDWCNKVASPVPLFDWTERGEGKCPEVYDALLTDTDLEEWDEYCRANEKACALTYGELCTAAWKADQKYVMADCWSTNCNNMCKKRQVSWCLGPGNSGLSTGAIVGIVIGVVVGVAIIVGGVVFFVLRKKGSGAGA
jgi:hypothetical protein